MGYLIDTGIWVEVERGALRPEAVAAVTADEPVYLSPVTIAELKFGAEIAPNAQVRQKRLAAIQRLLKKPVLRMDADTALIFGELAAMLRRRGRGAAAHRTQDVWLASQAIQHGLRLLTRNEKDFKDIPGLDLVFWRESQPVTRRSG